MRPGPFRALAPLVLASASPRRQALLAAQGLAFEVLPSALPEPAPVATEIPAAYALRMARLKGDDVALRHPRKVIISADTIVVQDSQILGKPQNEHEALDMLKGLSGGWHEVITGFCVLRQDPALSTCHTVSTRVHMAENSHDQLAAYIATGEPMDKAGAYGIQGLGAFLVDEVQGSYTNVVGLPLRAVLNILLETNAIGVAHAHHPAQTR